MLFALTKSPLLERSSSPTRLPKVMAACAKKKDQQPAQGCEQGLPTNAEYHAHAFQILLNTSKYVLEYSNEPQNRDIQALIMDSMGTHGCESARMKNVIVDDGADMGDAKP